MFINISNGLLPFKLISGAVVSSIITLDVVVDSLPALSVAVHVTSVVPKGKLCGVYVIIGFDQLSVAVASVNIGVVEGPVASNVCSSGAIIIGSVVS